MQDRAKDIEYLAAVEADYRRREVRGKRAIAFGTFYIVIALGGFLFIGESALNVFTDFDSLDASLLVTFTAGLFVGFTAGHYLIDGVAHIKQGFQLLRDPIGERLLSELKLRLDDEGS